MRKCGEIHPSRRRPAAKIPAFGTAIRFEAPVEQELLLASLVAPERCVGCGLNPSVTTTMNVPEAAVTLIDNSLPAVQTFPHSVRRS